VKRALQAPRALMLAFHRKTLAREKLVQKRTEFRVVIDQ